MRFLLNHLPLLSLSWPVEAEMLPLLPRSFLVILWEIRAGGRGRKLVGRSFLLALEPSRSKESKP